MNGNNNGKNDFTNDEESQAVGDVGSGPQRLSDEIENAIPVDAVAEAMADAEKWRNEFLYLRAEFDNFKKQAIKERSDIRKYGAERLVVDLLNVLDIFETALAMETTPENFGTFQKGIEMTASELKNVLQRNGVEEVPAKGKPFDPNLHEALSSEETNEAPSGSITQVFKKPYKLHDRVVRPGQVVVAKPKA